MPKNSQKNKNNQIGVTEDKQEKQKKKLVLILETTPIIQTACVRAGISRATYYRWKKEDNAFAKAIEKKIATGREYVNDMAESQVMNRIRDGNLSAAIFWLKHNYSKRYGEYQIRVIANNNYSSDRETYEAIEKLKKLLDEDDSDLNKIPAKSKKE